MFLHTFYAETKKQGRRQKGLTDKGLAQLNAETFAETLV